MSSPVDDSSLLHPSDHFGHPVVTTGPTNTAAGSPIANIRAISARTWRGSLVYFRIQGPAILIEYSMQEPNHVHTIYRDPSNDYGGITF